MTKFMEASFWEKMSIKFHQKKEKIAIFYKSSMFIRIPADSCSDVNLKMSAQT